MVVKRKQSTGDIERDLVKKVLRRNGFISVTDEKMNSSTDRENLVVYPPLHIVGRYWVCCRGNNYTAPTPSPFTFEVLAKVGNKWATLFKSSIYYDTPDGYHIVEAQRWVARHFIAPPRLKDENEKDENLWRWMKRCNITEERRNVMRKKYL